MPTYDNKDSSVTIYYRCWLSDRKEAQVRKERASAASGVPAVNCMLGSQAVVDNS